MIVPDCDAPLWEGWWKGGVEEAGGVGGGGVRGDVTAGGGVLAFALALALSLALAPPPNPRALCDPAVGGSWERTLLEDPPNTELEPRVINGMTTTPSESSTTPTAATGVLEGGEEGEGKEEDDEEDGLLLCTSYEVARVMKDTVATSPLSSPT